MAEDVDSEAVVVSVKHQTAPVGLKPVREIAGVAAAEGKRSLVFTCSGYIQQAEAFASSAGVALLVYDSQAGSLRGANPTGVAFTEAGSRAIRRAG
ncbi:restriction endonuclease [Agromyces sp. MMS24-K17]|uniref:restriction endonuclease n=1 Tax=Agromyces sp. MMS24-K17 TaxID=3372850 RepID=UPI0037545D98